jgi:3-hydroxyisobutyrate dehydrogenase-like beta-hydroxyacid dehydrogenase
VLAWTPIWLSKAIASQAAIRWHAACFAQAIHHQNEKGIIMKVGFIGLGKMGAAMAANLLNARHNVTVYNRTASKAKALTDRGAALATKVADACHGDAVITMLADDRAVEAIVFDEGGLLQSLDQGTIHVSMSTISLALSQRLTEAHEGTAQRFVAAPVFGRPDVAAAGKLYIMPAGPADLIDACAPLFNAMGQKTLRVGDKPPHANLVKLSGNFLLASTIEALGEAFALIGKAGIDRHYYFEILTSTLFTGPVFTNYGGLIANRKFHPALFAAPLGAKDIRLALAAAESLRVPMPLGSLLHDRFLTLLANGGEGLDWSAIGQLAASDAGFQDFPK